MIPSFSSFRIKVFFFVFCSLLFSNLWAQSPDPTAEKVVDSLEKALAKAAEGSSGQAEILSELAWKLRNSDFDKALFYAKKGIEAAKKAGNPELEAQSNSFAGVIYRNKGDYTKAMGYYFEALTVAETHQVDVQIGYAYNNIGDLYKVQNQLSLALENTQKAIPFFEKVGNKRGLAYAYIRLAEIYAESKIYDKALVAYEKCLKIREEQGDKEAIASTLNGMGILYVEQKEFEKAIPYLQNSLEIAEQNISDKRLSGAYNHLAQAYLGLGQIPKADSLAQRARFFAEKLDAKSYLKEALQTLADVKEKAKQPDSALFYLRAYADLQGQMLNEQGNKQIENLKNAYELQKKQIELDNIKAQEGLQNKIRLAMVGLILLLFGFLAVAYQNYRKQKKLYALLEKKQAEVKSQNQNLASQTQEIQEQNEKLQASEEELKQNLEQMKEAQMEIESQKEVLEDMLFELKTAQSQLVQAEKMATLGQLVANIAHEINTPMAAIRSCSQSMALTLEELLPSLPTFLKSLSQEDFALFQLLIQNSLPHKELLSTKERRNLKYSLADWLDQNQKQGKISPPLHFEQDRFADSLTEMGTAAHFLANSQDLVQLLQTQNPILLVDTAASVLSLYKNNHTISAATERASKIIFALKSYSRQEKGTAKQKIDINESLDTTLVIYHNTLKQGIEVEKKWGILPQLEAFGDELNQVWANLIHNAIQAMQGKGRLTLQTMVKDNAILVGISDTGAGIALDIQEKIFEPFFTTKKVGEGSGLGLDIVRKIVEKHEGKIWFETQVGEGTTFWVRLPIL
ncbi:ATP-binding protein [Hugenholtzia roseola]|uniref:ATP-binding protein n=1 Tax=Hugenholtzia roseola TaxID=1002 RepID=UPI000407A066|nr:ATP-binding protein [Hugenholtzia roseola]